MSRWRGKGSSSEEDVADSVLVVRGSIRSPDETDALVVTLRIAGQEIAMHGDGSELGRWNTAAVEIVPIDMTSFDFIAEGDRLIFSPDDPSAFAIIPLVGGTVEEKRERRGLRRKKKQDGGTFTKATADAQTKAAKSNTQPPAAQEKPPPAARKKPRRTRRREKPRQSKKGVPAETSKGATSKKPEEKRSGVWIRTLDTARRYDVLGLDRVPIDEDLRGKKHEHTWDHRVAATSGPGKHICTICGKIRW
ncbi:MAG: hypothetical protein M3112_07270 [Actinomycetia bacterium]|nr:hypothetical protein [Actinomycetes bacterium]